MQLARLRLVGVRPFGDVTIPFADADGRPRRLCVLFGASGTGKSAIVSAIASTRPGYSVALPRPRGLDSTAPPPFAVANWSILYEEPQRPGLVVVASPNAALREDEVLVQRREQAALDRRACDGGFVLVSLSGARWFSRSANALTMPDRTVLRYDVRAAPALDDPSRADVARETKQALSYFKVARALCDSGAAGSDALRDLFTQRERELDEVVRELVGDLGYALAGVDPIRLEPVFRSERGELVDFDELPRGLRHLLCFGVSAFRALAAAHRQVTSVRATEGIALIDDVELHQDSRVARTIGARLCRALPAMQWVLTTSSPAVAVGCDATELITLAKSSARGPVELHLGTHALVH